MHAKAAPVVGAAFALVGLTAAGTMRHAQGPPPSHTGGFGEPTCQVCHAEAEVNVPGGVLGVDGMPAVYSPGERYVIAVVLVSEDMSRAGFQGAFRFSTGDDRGKQAGRVEPINRRISTQVTMPTGIVYVQHTEAGTQTVDSEQTTWTFAWIAPESGDPVVFHVAANSANGDDSPFGDLIYTAEAASAGPGR